ncbi:MAG TPA: ATP-binding protein [Bryobacteraceae bacterium]|nr:ATP-binding protein [Bryobacteraceae bacterium]
MRRLGHRVQLGVFLAAVCVPCIALVALGLRIVAQDRELAEKRRADERRREVLRVHDALLARLEPIRRSEIQRDLEPAERYRHPEVVFVARVQNGVMVLPWEADRAARRCRALVSRPYFEGRIRKCEQSNFGAEGGAVAARCYERALGAARNPVQAAYARWLWAQALDRAGENKRAAELFRTLLDAPPEITDEDGVPLALYAARRLAPSAADQTRVIERAKTVCLSRPWLPPIAWLPLTEMAATLDRTAKAFADDLRKQAESQARMFGQAERLRDDFARLGLLGEDGRPEPVWAPYGDEGWLVGAAEGAVIVVRGPELLRSLNMEPTVRLVDYREPQGESLGAAFPGLKAVLAQAAAPAEDGNGLQRRLYYTMLFLIVAVTTFAGYLLWRDLQREMRVAELRAQFVASISHELKTPLTAIRMFAETLQLRRAKDPEMEEEYLDTIVNECERLSRLVDGVLLFSKAEQGKKIYHFRPVQPAAAVREAVRALRYQLSQQGFELQMEIDDGLPVITADRDALVQATLNLLTHAMKYSGDSRVIELRVGRENASVAIRVTDHGVGIAAEDQARIFEKFYRVPTRENQAIPGAGLGLALVAQIARAHGGKADVFSAPGQGSTFIIRIPVEPARET